MLIASRIKNKTFVDFKFYISPARAGNIKNLPMSLLI